MTARVLVFNRGEIAVRACLAARRLGLSPVLFLTPDDARAPAVRYADAVHLCARSEARESFLSLEELGRAVRATRAEWVYPGYGFLSETEELRRAVEDAGAELVGPSALALRTMAHKGLSLELARRAGVADLEVPLPADGSPPSPDLFPLLLKAAKGGGGRGNALVLTADAFGPALAQLRARAHALFHDDAVLAERYLPHARHVELQIFGVRGHGVRVLGTRDCSLQRSYQKILEEGPASPRARDAALSLAGPLVKELDAMEYSGAGTIELLWDSRSERAYFIEINPRIQVEHTVTELLVGEDLVEWQLREATGIARDDLATRPLDERGHALQARIYAEDPRAGFAPDAGTVEWLDAAPLPFCRWDVGVTPGARISPHYDPLLAKLVVWGSTRSEAFARTSACLRASAVHGVRTNLAMLGDLVDHAAILSDAHHVSWVEESFLPAFRHGESQSRAGESESAPLGRLVDSSASPSSTVFAHPEELRWKRGHRG